MRYCENPNTSHVTLEVASQPGKGRRLLWVDDSGPLLGLYKMVFENLGFQVEVTCSPHEALDRMSSQDMDAAILDYEMPEMDGGILASLIKRRHPELPVILYSGSILIPQNARHWVDAICSKAAPREELLTIIETLAQRAELRARNEEHLAQREAEDHETAMVFGREQSRQRQEFLFSSR